ncbi:MAG: hypothetical protein ACI4R8_01800 [Candidatus Caccovivens sp.]
MKKVKRCFLIVLCVCFSFILLGCESETKVRSAFISDMTGPLSTRYSIKVVLEEDDRVSDKYVDLQLKVNQENQQLLFGEENGDEYTLRLPKSDYWYNLTYLISQTNGTGVEAGYKNYEDFGTRVFNFASNNDCKVTFRVVVGQVKTNEETGENILVLSEDISEEVTVDVKKYEEK